MSNLGPGGKVLDVVEELENETDAEQLMAAWMRRQWDENDVFGFGPGWDITPFSIDMAGERELFAENNEREAALWGNLLDDKRFLQTRGYVIFWKDHAKGLICCDNKILSCRQLVILADRTRRDLTT